MIGRRRTPCCDRPVRLPDVEDLHDKTCPRCGQRWRVLVEVASDEVCAKVGGEVFKATWFARKVKS